jgi:uncharacterized damage-inducible protein DinB
MVSPAYLNLLLDFHYWARDRVLDAVATLTAEQYTRDLGNSFKSVRDTLVHLFSAEHAWYERWQGNSPAAHLSPGDYPDVATLRRAWSAHESRMRAFIAAQDQAAIDRVYDYKLFNGTASRSALWQMVTHVVNHGTYHRGQVTTMLRQLGAAPAKGLDLIAYYREGAAPRG